MTDTIIAEPQATLNGAVRAGLVRVVLGSGKGVFGRADRAKWWCR
ncbi:hypothetical protein AB0C93_12085 [Streptomyces sp. NPDC048518]